MASTGIFAELRNLVLELLDRCPCLDSSPNPESPNPPKHCPSLQTWSTSEHQNYLIMCSGKKCSWIIPLGGNAFILNPEEGSRENVVNPCGLANWNNSSSLISTYFHSTRPGEVLIALRLRVPYSGSSKILVSVDHAKSPIVNTNKNNGDFNPQTTREIEISGTDYQLVPCGKFHLPADGYMRLDLQGISRSGAFFADVTHIVIIPESNWFTEQTCVKFVADPQDFYFGRRGPSVHLRYELPLETNLEYFYTELTVPQGEDIIGAYFCAAGFRGGYFGMQVNGKEERRMLFSIWSAWQTDNPGDIPDDYKIELLRKGPGVVTGEFGDEGSGGQSYLVFPWVADRTYRFLVYAKPLDADNTVYTAWFNTTGGPVDWNLIASFRKPKDSTYLKDIYAFSENFIPEMGHIERQCVYGNQWVRDRLGAWLELNKATFTADATAAQQNRMDICGGIHGPSGQFFLRNCGFFSDAIAPNTDFQRNALGVPPQIDFNSLP